jgi:Amidohydrolase family
MKIRIVVLLILPALLLAQVKPDRTAPLALTHVNIIDVTGGELIRDSTVVITGDRISAIGPSANTPLPTGAKVIDATGQFLIPGLWDMHIHLSDARPSVIPSLVANGVTGVRDMGSLLREVDEWRVRIEDGTVVGPRIFRAGPIINGEEFGPVQLAVADPAEARAAVRTLAKTGVDFIKIHLTLTRDQFFAIADEAKKVGLPFVGHIPSGVTPEEASDSGLGSIEHTQHNQDRCSRTAGEF